MLQGVRRSLPAGASSRPVGRLWKAVFAVAVFVSMAMAASPASYPYTPATFLLPPADGLSTQQDGHLAYLITPNGKTVDIRSLDISSALDAASLKFNTIQSGLPFLDSSSSTNTAFSSSILENGTIAVFAGDCSSGSSTKIWTFSPPNSTSSSSNPWTTYTISTSSTVSADKLGPSFLGQNIAFSSQIEPSVSQPVIYSYGGMCPSSDGRTASTWQSSSQYSNQMLKLTPGSDTAYSASLITSKGPPIAEAGFTFTSLTPSISNRSGIVTQQVNYVLLGGHTKQAFINMSTAAVWSLPEENWSFTPISAPDTANTELAKKEGAAKRSLPTSVDSRSGHTAVLAEDGNALIIFGGWVGDVSQAAEPQLAVLEMGAGYGQWQWRIPSSQPSGNGIYGHAAALLPGNMMMIYGGYSISGSTSKRDATPMFLNLTSFTWSNTYTNPSHDSSTTSKSSPGSDSKTTKLGLGLGLGLGIPLLLLLLSLGFCMRRRHRVQARRRDAAVKALAQDHAQFLHGEDDDMVEVDRGAAFPFEWGSATRSWYTGGDDPYVRGGRSLGYESLRGSRPEQTFQPLPHPKEVLRKPLRNTARGLYQPTTIADYESRAGQRGAGNIHPIYEADEDGGEGPVKESPENEDPFMTPTGAVGANSARSLATPSPDGSHAKGQDREVQDWVSDVDTGDVMMAARYGGQGVTAQHSRRLSPTRRASTRSKASSPTNASFNGDDEARTASNLSDKSALSFMQNVSRSASIRLGLGAVPITKEDGRLGSSSGSSNSSHTYNTAKTTFPALQAEGPALLQGRSRDEGARDDDDYMGLPGSPSKSKPPRRNWLGSLRRVFSSSGTGSSGTSRDGSPSRSLDSSSGDYEPRNVGLAEMPNATLLRRKQGRADWDQASIHEKTGPSDEWDVERAVEQRMVQIMFTVPRDKLRVVNAEVEKEEEEAEVFNARSGSDEEQEMDLGEQSRMLAPEPDSLDTPSRQHQHEGLMDESNYFDPVISEKVPWDDDNHEVMRVPTPPMVRGEDLEKTDPVQYAGDKRHSDYYDEDEWEDIKPFSPPMSSAPEMEQATRHEDPPTPLMTAEAVRLKRPGSRVMEIVQQIESQSRHGSPPV
ncbi:uncharacterized protein E0L32_007286 [Thyridium curvatum]|uniref:Galactose oxidase n=1 Tax=Thyridium curvatum TaxID=1093900 RepID=A0A507AW81_9PEZI|nr:uncharacterized protein E0L32_007286 [Thyridium curvatum]TPX11983.1 hypothetical protein E0L32_007286 [Thyridium curvatum]